MEPRRREWYPRRYIIIINPIFRLQLIWLHIIEPPEHLSQHNIQLRVRQTILTSASFPSFKQNLTRLVEAENLLDTNTHPTPSSEWHICFLHMLHISGVCPTVGIEFRGVGEILFIVVKLPGAH